MKTREGLYAFLAKMYLEHPPRELAEDMKSGRFSSFADSLAFNPEMKAGIETLKGYAAGAKGDIYDDMENEFVTLFIGMGGKVILPFESEYTEMSPAESRLKAKRAYAKSGFKKSDDCSEPDDHIAIELEFMRYLCKNQLEAVEDKKKLRALLAFQTEHLGEISNWISNFCAEIRNSKKASFYPGVAELTTGFLAFVKEVINDLITSI